MCRGRYGGVVDGRAGSCDGCGFPGQQPTKGASRNTTQTSRTERPPWDSRRPVQPSGIRPGWKPVAHDIQDRLQTLSVRDVIIARLTASSGRCTVSVSRSGARSGTGCPREEQEKRTQRRHIALIRAVTPLSCRSCNEFGHAVFFTFLLVLRIRSWLGFAGIFVGRDRILLFQCNRPIGPRRFE